jgi:hypothetical protein
VDKKVDLVLASKQFHISGKVPQSTGAILRKQFVMDFIEHSTYDKQHLTRQFLQMEKMADQFDVVELDDFHKYFETYKQVSIAYYLCFITKQRQTGNLYINHITKMMKMLSNSAGGTVEGHIKLSEFRKILDDFIETEETKYSAGTL